ncbi:MAG: hypothetical protein F4X66_13215 [Chloroflexi bacterium]|nr:hypothetical protein [Chloroflexota bacterium]MYE38737.1 hypothetical protein [Chloroflexota bacterium]
MATFTPDKVSLDTATVATPAAPQDAKAHNGPVARLLARVSKWSDDYADYQMETGTWRKIAI